MNRHLTIIRIKNSDFDFTQYGLKNNYFSIDVTNSISYSRNIGVTQYAVLDGTTRLDNISREPGSLSLQGLLGELRAGNNPEHFAYDTVERNRLQNQMDLLEALRDQAIFVDFITDERTYRNYLITGCSFGKTNFGKIDLNISAREAITFGDDITIENANALNYISDYEQDLILERFEIQPINSDAELVEEINRIVFSSVLSTPFIISLGPIDINPDVVMPTYSITKRSTNAILPTNTGQSITVADTNFTTMKIEATELYTGIIAGGNYLHISTPLLDSGVNLYKQRITRNASGSYEYANLGTTPLHIRLLNGEDTLYSVQKTEILKTPLYSDVTNGVHTANKAGSNTDIVSEAQFGINFLRKQKFDNYTILPNLLGLESKGYLYNATFEQTTGNKSTIYPILVYIQPIAWKKIKTELERVWSESAYFKNKTLGGL